MADDKPAPVWVVGQFVGRAPAGDDLLTFEFVYLEDPLRWEIRLSGEPPRPAIGFEPFPGVEYVDESWVRLDAANIVYEAGPEMVRKYTEAVKAIREQSGADRIKAPTDADIIHINSKGQRG